MIDRTRVMGIIAEHESTLRRVSAEIHAHPELLNEETYAAQLLSEELDRAGFQVERGVAGLPTAIRAIYPVRSQGPTIAILGEYDALPEIGHACGHNLIAAAGLGAAIALGELKTDLPGTVMFLGTPAEEGGGGKVVMVEQGVFEGIDAAMMFHPANHTMVSWGSLAISEVEIAFRGRPSHASAEPHKGINALDAVIQTFNGINALRQHILDGARIHGIITNGGAKPNIVPEFASALFYVRAEDTSYRDELLEKLRACAAGAAIATGATLDFHEIGYSYKAMKPNAPLEKRFEENLQELGETIRPPERRMLGSTDMGDVSQVVPAIHPYLQICDEQVATHSRPFADAAISERGQRAMLTAATALALTAADVLTDPQLVESMWNAFGEPSRSP